MKIINKLYLPFFLLFITSCTYEYIMPDMSNATPHPPKASEPSYEYFVTWNMEFTSFMVEELEKFGYEGYNNKIITEKDQNGNILFQGDVNYGTTKSQPGAKTIEVGIEYYGWPKGFHGIGKAIKIGIYTFGPFILEEITGKEIILSQNMPFTFKSLLHDADRFLYNITLGDDVRKKLVEIAESLGYEYAGRDIIMTEIDKDGFRFHEKYWSSIYENYYSQEGAIKLEIKIKLRGKIGSSFYNLGILKFDEPLLLKDICNQNAILTLDMPYTFIKQ